MKININAKVLTLLLLTGAVSSRRHLRRGRRMISSEDCAVMKLVEDAMDEMGQKFSGFFDNLPEEGFGSNVSNFINNADFENEDFDKDMNDFINNFETESNGFLSNFFGRTSDFFDGASQYFGSYSSTTELNNDPNAQESDEIPKSTTIVEKVEYHHDAHGTTSDKTVETTKTYADGHTTHNVEHFPGPSLEEESSFSDIMMGYKDVIETITPKMLKLPEDKANDLTVAVDEMYNKFEDKTKDMDAEDILLRSDISKEELLQDYDNFSVSFEEAETEDVDDIAENEDLTLKFDKLADNFHKVVKFV